MNVIHYVTNAFVAKQFSHEVGGDLFAARERTAWATDGAANKPT